LQARKLLMDSDQIANSAFDEKYPQFLMSWGPLRKDGQGKHERTQSEIGLEREMGTNATMYFGKTGDILTFASYATKERHEEMSFCRYLSGALKGCCARILFCCCCEQCRGDKERRRVIEERRVSRYARETHATAIKKDVKANMGVGEEGEVCKI